MRLLLEVERVREQRRREEGDVPGAMRFTRRSHDAAQVRRLGPFTGQLGAIALGGRPLIAEHVRRGWLSVGGEQINEAECQKCPLPQTYLWGGGWLIRHTLQEDGMGKTAAARTEFSAHARRLIAPDMPDGKTITRINIALVVPAR
jgi:hypothetical protein